MPRDAEKGTDVQTAPVVDVPAITVRVQQQVADGRVIDLQTHMFGDWPLAQINAMVDKVTRIADRQKAAGELVEMRRTFSNTKLEEARVRGLAVDQRAVATAAVEAARREFEETCDAEERKHGATGKRAAFDVEKSQPCKVKAKAHALAVQALAEFEANLQRDQAMFKQNVANWEAGIERKIAEIAALGEE